MPARAASAVVVGLLASCGETPGESHLSVHAAEDASLVWERDFATEELTLRDTRPDVLQLQGTDRCWDAMFLSDFDRQTGQRLRDYPIVGWDGVGGAARLDPPSSCAGQSALERVTLPSGRTVDVCFFTSASDQLIVMDTATGMEHVRLTIEGASALDVARFGDRLVIVNENRDQIDMFSLEDGAALWSWTTPGGPYRIVGGDSERLYVWHAASEIYALSFADGSPVWQEDLGCEWLTYTDGLLLCGEQLRGSTCESE
jgi:outer membrane protein assembly factor BamB